MNIMFLVVDQEKPHEGVVRPFLNLARGLSKRVETSITLHSCGDALVDHVSELELTSMLTQGRAELQNAIRRQRPDFVVYDDNIQTLRVVNSLEVRRLVSLVVYAQVLYGTHSIAGCFDPSCLSAKEKVTFSLSSCVPFSVLRRRFVNALNNREMIIANSNATANLLHTLYGIGVQGVVYPPVDTEVFEPSGNPESRAGVTLYLGSRAGDTRVDLARAIINRAQAGRYVVNLFGSERLWSILKRSYSKLDYFSDLDDRELAKLYSQSLLTVCPQRWETFGMVPVESTACGTPALAMNCMGQQETIVNGQTGLLVDNDKEFLGLLEGVLRREIGEFPETALRDYAIRNFSIPTCADQLMKCLRKGPDRGAYRVAL